MAEPPSPPLFASLRSLDDLPSSLHQPFICAVADHLARSTPPSSLHLRFNLPLSRSEEEPSALLQAAKALLSRIVARPYADGGREALLADLTSSGLSQSSAEWLCVAGESATSPLAEQIRTAQVHSAEALFSSYLHDFDWQVPSRPARLNPAILAIPSTAVSHAMRLS